jgi:hypothetical protein
MSFGSVVVRFDLSLSLVLTLCLFDGLSGGIAVFLISGSSNLKLSPDVACNPLLLVGVCSYGHCGDEVINALIDEASD